jgi:hypothetical protein
LLERLEHAMPDESGPDIAAVTNDTPRPSGAVAIGTGALREADAWLSHVRTACYSLLLALEAAAAAEEAGDTQLREAAEAKTGPRFEALRGLVAFVPARADGGFAASVRDTVEALAAAHATFEAAPRGARERETTALLRAIDAAMRVVPTWRRG